MITIRLSQNEKNVILKLQRASVPKREHEQENSQIACSERPMFQLGSQPDATRSEKFAPIETLRMLKDYPISSVLKSPQCCDSSKKKTSGCRTETPGLLIKELKVLTYQLDRACVLNVGGGQPSWGGEEVIGSELPRVFDVSNLVRPRDTFRDTSSRTRVHVLSVIDGV